MQRARRGCHERSGSDWIYHRVSYAGRGGRLRIRCLLRKASRAAMETSGRPCEQKRSDDIAGYRRCVGQPTRGRNTRQSAARSARPTLHNRCDGTSSGLYHERNGHNPSKEPSIIRTHADSVLRRVCVAQPVRSKAGERRLLDSDRGRHGLRRTQPVARAVGDALRGATVCYERSGGVRQHFRIKRREAQTCGRVCPNRLELNSRVRRALPSCRHQADVDTFAREL